MIGSQQGPSEVPVAEVPVVATAVVVVALPVSELSELSELSALPVLLEPLLPELVVVDELLLVADAVVVSVIGSPVSDSVELLPAVDPSVAKPQAARATRTVSCTRTCLSMRRG